MLHEGAHHPAGESEGRLKAAFFQSVEAIEVLGNILTVVHSSTLRQAESKKPSPWRGRLLFLLTG